MWPEAAVTGVIIISSTLTVTRWGRGCRAVGTLIGWLTFKCLGKIVSVVCFSNSFAVKNTESHRGTTQFGALILTSFWCTKVFSQHHNPSPFITKMTMVGPQRHAMDRPNFPLGTRLFSEPSAVNSPARPLPMKNEDNCIEIGYYTHQKSLGEGGFGKVKLATHLKTNQKVAIKMMNKEKLGVCFHFDARYFTHFYFVFRKTLSGFALRLRLSRYFNTTTLQNYFK